MATALTNYYQQKSAALAALKTTTLAAFQTASAALAIARSDLEVRVATSKQLSGAIASKRVQMASPANMPADVELLAVELRTLLVSRRHNVAALLNAEQAISKARAELQQLTAQLSEQDRDAATLATELAAAQARALRHSSWLSSEVNDIISAVKSEAQALLDVDAGAGAVDPEDNTGLISDARIRVNSDIPAVLRNRARARSAGIGFGLSQQRALLTSLTGLQRTQASAVAADSGLIAQRWGEYESAESALKTHAVTLTGELNRAVNLLSAIVASAALTSAESARIDAVALASDSAAITTETDLTDARAAVAAKQVDLQLAIAAALVSDVSADPSSDADVQDEQALLTTLQADLAAAEAAHSQALADELDAWEGAVPDTIWANLHKYDQAIAALNRIVSSNGVTLAGAFSSAETALVAALTEVDNHNRLSQLLASDATLASARLEYLRGAAGARQLSAARGDF